MILLLFLRNLAELSSQAQTAGLLHRKFVDLYYRKDSTCATLKSRAAK